MTSGGGARGAAISVVGHSWMYPCGHQPPAANSQQQLCVAFAERKPHGNASSCEEQAAESRRRMPQNWITGRMRDVWLWEEVYTQR